MGISYHYIDELAEWQELWLVMQEVGRSELLVKEVVYCC